MKHIITKILLFFALLAMLPLHEASAASSKDEPIYTTLRSIDLGTFNEFRYRITEQFFILRENYQVNNALDVDVIRKIAVLADEWYKYLPDNLVNKNYLAELNIDLKKGAKYPGNESAYTEIIQWVADYIEKVEISSVSGSVEASPISGNAPLVTTLRAKVQDPTGSKILDGNYTWWIDNAGQKVVIGRGPSINYSFRNEGKYSVFLDVTSSHKNEEGFTDVLPYRERIDISVNEKIASLIVKVNSDSVKDNTLLKFTPDDAAYGLLFDATSSTPTSGTQFSSTSWDFGNGVTRSYRGSPKIERIRYGREGDYEVKLKMVTNEWKSVESTFIVSIHDPIATIEVNREDGFIGDKFTFAAKTSGVYRDLTYNWEIVNIDADRVIHQVSDKVLTYSFSDKWKYNVRLKVRRSSGEVDQDTRIVYVTSQAPIAEFETEIKQANKPNKVFLDASRSFDPDISDDGNLRYDWYIDGARVKLQDANANGSVWYFTFDSVGTHSVNLEVTDLDGLTTIKKWSVDIDSILSVDMYAFPRVIQRDGFIRFVAESPEAELYEWDFWDGKQTGWSIDKTTHTYDKSGSFDVKLTVSDKENNSNTFTRTVYVSDSDTPLAFIDLSYGTLEKPLYDADACEWAGGYIVDRVSTLKFDGSESINIDGENNGLEYSWKIGNGKFATSTSVSHRFDEIGCFPVKLTVKSDKNNKTSATEMMLDVRNVKPTMSSLRIQVEDPLADPLIVRVDAQGANDPDGVIQSYLWYYYTDTDSEPQDFRATSTSATAFVIPKITGNYYFVAILKDNNESRVTSEEVTGAKYFTTVTGDNINTPIVDLEVNDNSTIIGEEITFTAKAKNILGQEIVKDASFSWDFDGDGFYDTQTSTPTTTYKYRKSGEFYAKVKVKYRGISSTKNITMNVSNKLVADFDYISIGNKTIFFDTSGGQIDSRTWDLGDGTKKSGTYFEHTYTDGKVTHEVTLSITEGTKVKEVKKSVKKNIKNILKTRSGNLVAFTSPVIEDGKIVLDDQSQKAFVYMGESIDSATVYGIDYDIENDSDLNGWADDDEDNKGTASYVSGDVIEIPLSPYNTQNVRLFLKDAEGNVLGTQDFTIEKTYIEEQNIDPDTIVFEWVSESEKEKIEALKAILLKLPQQQKLRSLNFVQKLQENWNDNTEKTRTILDFENYIFELGLSNEDELIGILESLLVEWQEDQSAKQITYQALVNLIPKDIVCSVEEGTCYDTLLSKLEDIRSSDDVEYNKALGKEILEAVGGTDLMTNDQKLDFKAILTSLVYGWEVSEIPEAEKNEVIEQEPTKSQWESSGGLGILMTILKWIWYFILGFLVIVWLFYLVYLIFNKDKEKSFSEFVSQTTSFSKSEAVDVEVSDAEDILAEFEDEKIDTSDILSTPVDPLSEKEVSQEKKTQAPKIEKQEASSDEVPAWLKWNFADDVKPVEDTNLAPKKEETIKKKTETAPIPKPEVKQAEKKEEKESVKESPKKSADVKEAPSEKEFDLEKDTKISDDSTVPDWLKGSFDAPKKEAAPEAQSEDKTEAPKQEKAEVSSKKKDSQESKQAKAETPVKTETPSTDATLPATDKTDTKPILTDADVPDWLKGSFDEPKKEESKPEAGPEKEVVEGKGSEAKASSEPKKTESTAPKKPTQKKNSIKKEVVPKKTTEKKIESEATPKTDTKDESVKKDELWDDGMKIPDWLKADE